MRKGWGREDGVLKKIYVCVCVLVSLSVTSSWTKEQVSSSSKRTHLQERTSSRCKCPTEYGLTPFLKRLCMWGSWGRRLSITLLHWDWQVQTHAHTHPQTGTNTKIIQKESCLLEPLWILIHLSWWARMWFQLEQLAEIPNCACSFRTVSKELFAKHYSRIARKWISAKNYLNKTFTLKKKKKNTFFFSLSLTRKNPIFSRFSYWNN